MKKIIAILLSAITAISFVGCKDKAEIEATNGSIVETTPNSGYIEIDKGETDNYLVKNHQAQYTIVVPAKATETEAYAASELKAQIDEAAYCNIHIESDEGKTFNQTDKVISIGKTVYQSGAALPDADYEGLNGGYLIKSVGNVYVLDADTKNGLIYSVNNFLTYFFGVEYLTWDTVYVPEDLANVKAYPANIKDVPTFRMRDFYSYPVWYKTQTEMSKLAMNSPSVDGDEKFDDPFYYGYYYSYDDGKTVHCSPREGHTIEYLLCVDAYRNGIIENVEYKTSEGGANPNMKLGYVNEHPEWYAYDPSYNRIHGGNGRSQEEVCYSNGLTLSGEYDETYTDSLASKIIEICKTMIREETSENAQYLMLGHADWYAQCKCAQCTEMYKTFGSDFSGLYCVWANAIAKEVKDWMAEEGIDKPVKFVIFAYSKSITAPVMSDGYGGWVPLDEKIKLRDDIVVKMAWRYCVYHSLWDTNCAENEQQRLYFEQWSMLANEFTIWDYTCSFTNYLWYLNDYGALKENYTYYAKLNVQHLLTQGTPSEYNYYEYHLKAYVCLKLMWNVNQDVNALIEKFNNLYFGEKYAPYVNQYRSIFENQAAALDAERKNDGGWHISTTYELNAYSPDNYSRGMLEGAIQVIDDAIALAKADTQLSEDEQAELIKRLRSVKITPQYMLLTLKYNCDDATITAIAKDFFESIELLKITYMREGQTVANSFAEMKKGYDL